MGKKKKRIDTTVQEGLSHNPFAGLDSIAFPEADPNKLKEVLPSGPADAPIQKHPEKAIEGGWILSVRRLIGVVKRSP